MKKASNTISKAAARQTRLPVTVLHIDDDPNDSELFQAAARRASVDFLVQHVPDGEQAMAYLTGRGVYADRDLYPFPGLVLLDLKMPRATGFDVLQWIRNHPGIGDIPIVVFSGSELQDDMRQAYAGGADSYLVKPIGFGALVELAKTINDSWLAGHLPGTNCLTKSADSWRADPHWVGPAGEEKARP